MTLAGDLWGYITQPKNDPQTIGAGTIKLVLPTGLTSDTKSVVVITFISESRAIYAWPGYVLYVEGDTLLGQAFDAAHLELRGEPFTVAESVGRSTGFNIGVSASGSGMLAYAAAMLQRGRLTWFDRVGNSLNSVGVEGDYSDFRLSPRGQTLAVSLVDPKAWNPDIWLIDLIRGGPPR